MPDLAAQWARGMAVLEQVRTQQMVDAIAVARPGAADPTPTLDVDGNVLADPASAVYAGRAALVDPTSSRSIRATVNDDSGVPNTRELVVPADANLLPGDLVTVTAARFAPALVGDVFVVLVEHERTFASHRRYTLRGSSWRSNPPSP